MSSRGAVKLTFASKVEPTYDALPENDTKGRNQRDFPFLWAAISLQDDLDLIGAARCEHLFGVTRSQGAVAGRKREDWPNFSCD